MLRVQLSTLRAHFVRCLRTSCAPALQTRLFASVPVRPMLAAGAAGTVLRHTFRRPWRKKLPLALVKQTVNVKTRRNLLVVNRQKLLLKTALLQYSTATTGRR